VRGLLLRGLVVLLLALLVGACRGRGAPEAGEAGGRLDKPYPIEAFEAVDLDGRAISLAAWKGQVVIVNVWATWCAPCRREMPALSALQDKYPNQLRVLGILQDQVTTEFAREFLRSARVGYPVVRSTFDLEQHLPVVLALPTTFVIDPAGRLVAMYAAEVEAATLEREVLRLVGGGVPAS
jgi:thiol-disulfide isomerase/thioredoxin